MYPHVDADEVNEINTAIQTARGRPDDTRLTQTTQFFCNALSMLREKIANNPGSIEIAKARQRHYRCALAESIPEHIARKALR
jgi:hypothetical protein